jgi:hypothetical protein
MPDLWDTNPDNAFKAAGEQPVPAASGHDHPTEVRLKTTAAASGHPHTSCSPW